MGLFSKSVCPICGNECGGFKKIGLSGNTFVCGKCFVAAGISPSAPRNTITVDQVKALINSDDGQKEEVQLFTKTKDVAGYLVLDENKRQFYTKSNKLNKIVHNFDELVDFELLEDEQSITKGGLGRAAVGGALFGGTGAIVGSVTGGKKSKAICNTLKIKLTFNDISLPAEYINFITSKTKKDGIVYKAAYMNAQECLSVLQIICNSNDKSVIPTESAAPVVSEADEIMKFKNLMDQGIITPEEFEAKKNKILGI